VPSAVGKVPRPIPETPLHMNMAVILPVFGFIQFAAMYAEFSYLIDSMFRSHMYAMFGFLLVNFLLQMMIISLLSILQTYMQLCNQHWEWWWRSFFVGASGGLFMTAWLVYYSLHNMSISDLNNDVMMLIYIILFVVLYSTAAGAVAV